MISGSRSSWAAQIARLFPVGTMAMELAFSPANPRSAFEMIFWPSPSSRD